MYKILSHNNHKSEQVNGKVFGQKVIAHTDQIYDVYTEDDILTKIRNKGGVFDNPVDRPDMVKETIIIYANHLLRSAYPAMKKVAESILENERAFEIENLCMPVKDILNLVFREK